MAMSLNKAQLIGNLTRDPEVRQSANGTMVANFGLATNFTWTDSQGIRQTKAEFHNIVAWRKLAEICSTYLKKGSKVYIEGRIQTRDWEGQDGVKRQRTEIIADNMIMLDRKPAGAGGGFVPAEDSVPVETSIEEAPQKSVDVSARKHKAVPKEESIAPVGADEEINVEDLPF